MEIGTVTPHVHVDRRRFIGLGAAAAAAGSVAAVGVGSPAEAHGARREAFPCDASPKPIPQVIDTTPPGGEPAPDPFHFIHWLLPGPEGAATQILGLPAFGLDVDPSMITDFKGVVAYAVLAGGARDTDGNEFDCEFDVRVMHGEYVGVDGEHHHGTFGFF